MSTIKVNTVTKRTGSTLTLGESGTTVTLACGATQSGFGRAGSVNWCSTIYTNSPGTVTATSGKGFFLNTTSGAITINLPSSPTVGDIVAIKDYADTFDSNAVTVGRGGSKIAGLCLDATLNTEGQSVTLIYADATRGWLNVNTDSTVIANQFVEATGGTVITCGNFKTHIFTGDGCFQVTNAGQPSGSTVIDYLVVAGGGGGGGSAVAAGGQGGGGAGGFRISNSTTNAIPAPTMSPLVTTTAITASVATFPIAVGGGGTGGTTSSPAGGTAGAVSTFSTITSAGGGKGVSGACGIGPANSGGSGGGRHYGGPYPGAGGTGNTPPVSPPQGNPGGAVTGAADPPGAYGGMGGGGAGAAGSGGNAGCGGQGGGIGSFIADAAIGPTAPSFGTSGPVGSTRYFAGGGGGGNRVPNGPGGPTAPPAGGGGSGAKSPYPNPNAAPFQSVAGTVNTGGGGGGGNYNAGATGGSGIVILRYKFQ
jgi:hypothetical protein